MSGNTRDWEKLLPLALFASRDTPHTSTGLSPFEVMFGKNVRGPTTILKELWKAPRRIGALVLCYLEDLRRRTEKTAEVTAEIENKAKKDSKTYYDLRARDDPLEPGEEVLVLHPAGPRGITAQWTGPYLVEERLSPVSYRLGTPGKKGKVLHRNHVKRFLREYEVNMVVVAEDGEEFQQQLQLVDPLEETVDGPEAHTKDLRPDQTKELNRLLEDWGEVFRDTLGKTDRMHFEVNTGPAEPFLLRPYRIPLKWREKLDKEIKTLLRLGIIKESSRPWSSLVVCVRKPGEN